MNKVFLIGNLTRDPELTETSSGVSICRFSIAVNRNYSGSDGERKTDFFNIIAWRGLGEAVARYARKGKKVAVGGAIELRSYEDNQGVNRTAVDIVAQEVEFLTPRENTTDIVMDNSGARTDTERPNKQISLLQSFDDEDEDEDLPF